MSILQIYTLRLMQNIDTAIYHHSLYAIRIDTLVTNIDILINIIRNYKQISLHRYFNGFVCAFYKRGLLSFTLICFHSSSVKVVVFGT